MPTTRMENPVFNPHWLNSHSPAKRLYPRHLFVLRGHYHLRYAPLPGYFSKIGKIYVRDHSMKTGFLSDLASCDVEQ